MSTLLRYNLPEARRSVLGLFPELRRVTAVMATILHIENDEAFDAESHELACGIARAFWAFANVVHEGNRSGLDIGQRLALFRLRQGIRDACLTICWPTNGARGQYHIELNQRAIVALQRLRAYDRIRDTPIYSGALARDALALADGIAIQKARTE